MKKIELSKIILSIFFCLLFIGTTLGEPEILPDDPFYQAKQQLETEQLSTTLDPLEKATLHIKHATERLAGVKEMISKGKSEFVEDLLKDYENSIDGAMDEVKRAQVQGKDVRKALEAVERSTKKHIEVLTELLDKAPEQAKPAIQHSIEVSKRGRNIALEMLTRIQRDEITIGSPEGIGKSQGIGRPEGIERPRGFGGPGGGMPGSGRGRPAGRGR
jgi:hypothetical protein